MRITLRQLLVAAITPVWLQCSGQQLIATSGGSYYGGTYPTLEWSLGEIATPTLLTDAFVLTQGFQQPYILITSLDEVRNNLSIAHIYPNPVMHTLNIQLLAGYIPPRGWKLTDVTGNVVMEDIITSSLTTFDTSLLAQGVYLLQLQVAPAEVKTWRVVKH